MRVKGAKKYVRTVAGGGPQSQPTPAGDRHNFMYIVLFLFGGGNHKLIQIIDTQRWFIRARTLFKLVIVTSSLGCNCKARR